jgi:hypothetical protein
MISYFVRRYVKGVKGSGTKDLIKMDEAPQDFASLVEPFGPGKYILFNRQKGVRGFSKMIEHIVAEPIKAFAAESVSVKQNVDVGQVPTNQLKTLLSDMISKPQGSEDFANDMQKVYNEILSRADPIETLAAPGINSAGWINKQSTLGFVVGAAVVGSTVYQIKNKEINELKELIEKQSETVTKLAETVKLAEHHRKKAELAESAKQKMMRQKMGMDSEFLSEFNRANGWR